MPYSSGLPNGINRFHLWGWQEVFRAQAEKTDVKKGISSCGARKNLRAVRLLDFFDRCAKPCLLSPPLAALAGFAKNHGTQTFAKEEVYAVILVGLAGLRLALRAPCITSTSQSGGAFACPLGVSVIEPHILFIYQRNQTKKTHKGSFLFGICEHFRNWICSIFLLSKNN